MRRLKDPWCIQDGAGNMLQISGSRDIYPTFEAAEDALAEHLGEAYETDRQKYEIINLEEQE